MASARAAVDQLSGAQCVKSCNPNLPIRASRRAAEGYAWAYGGGNGAGNSGSNSNAVRKPHPRSSADGNGASNPVGERHPDVHAGCARPGARES